MAFLKFATPKIVKVISPNGWDRIRLSSKKSVISDDLTEQASKILKKAFNPNDYLLTHCSIISSVDTYGPKNVKTGSIEENGIRINRKYSDYRIKPESDKFINDNNDAWKRDVLLKSYKTFIGAPNWVEHQQIPEQTKGRVLDSVARDLGYTVYVDLLVATERKHRELVDRISRGLLNTLSMGCIIEESTCTKCGNVARDETELCSCVRYEKGNYFYDEFGKKIRVAELCGAVNIEPTAGVTFNDASWVEVPAFKGAVLRNIVTPQMVDDKVLNRARLILSSPPKVWDEDNLDGFIKAASLLKSSMKKVAADPEDTVEDAPEESDPIEETPEDSADEEWVDVGDEEDTSAEDTSAEDTSAEDTSAEDTSAEDDSWDDEGGLVDETDEEGYKDFEFGSEPPPEETDEDKTKESLKGEMDKVREGLIRNVIQDVTDAAKKIIGDKDKESKPATSSDTNDSIIRTAAAKSYAGMVRTATAQTDKPNVFLRRLARINNSFGIKLAEDIYDTVLEAGGTYEYGNVNDYLHTCRAIIARKVSLEEARALIRIGKLLNEVEGNVKPS